MLFAPVFRQDELVAIVGSVGHQVDVGGRSPGSYAGDVTEIYQEGLCLPPLKLYARGVPNAAVHAILAANVREPEKTLGDVRALVAALQIGRRGLLELIGKYGLATVRSRPASAEAGSRSQSASKTNTLAGAAGSAAARPAISASTTEDLPAPGAPVTNSNHGRGPLVVALPSSPAPM